VKKILIIILISGSVGLFFYLGLHQYLTFDRIKSAQGDLKAYTDGHFIQACLAFCAVYITSTALSLPGAALLTLLSGALFGLVIGTVIASISSTLGATLAFLASRHLLRDAIQSKFGGSFEKINQGIEKEGGFYLFTIRMIPAFPFFLVNLVMGLTKIDTFTYMWTSMAGMFLGTAIYVNAGTQLSELESPSGIFSPTIITSFIILGLFPMLSKKLITHLRKNKNG
jgi:uncharacterized membrane protein YdjX (TVP38/TMEM64 family)